MISFEESSLTKKQYDFCLAYMETGNATEAYRRCYSTDNMKSETVNRNAKALMDNNKISTTIHDAQDTITQEVLVKRKYDLEYINDLIEEAIKCGRIKGDGHVILKAACSLVEYNRLLQDDTEDKKVLGIKEKKLMERFVERFQKRYVDITPVEG